MSDPFPDSPCALSPISLILRKRRRFGMTFLAKLGLEIQATSDDMLPAVPLFLRLQIHLF